ncbi:MAG: N-formylglutamate deformylase [Janthinobacterium lividum]
MLIPTHYDLHRGDAPLLLSIPHVGTHIPDELRECYTPEALSVADTDWHLDTLYAFAWEMGATVLAARHSRYVIDLNRPEDDASLYPGKITTGLCPTETFRGEPVYRDGMAPHDSEKHRRVQAYWHPYHACLVEELARLRERHPHVLLWEAHSIASVLPRLFEGKLPDLNFGTVDGASAASQIETALQAVTAASPAFTSIMNGRFKGGYITRRYGAPDTGIHAVQLEMCQSTYMSESAPFEYVPALANQVQPVLARLVGAALQATTALPA